MCIDKCNNDFHLFSSHTSSLDLLGLSTPPSNNTNQPAQNNTLIDVLGDMYNGSVGVSNAKKYEISYHFILFVIKLTSVFFCIFLCFVKDSSSRTMEFCLKMK